MPRSMLQAQDYSKIGALAVQIMIQACEAVDVHRVADLIEYMRSMRRLIKTLITEPENLERELLNMNALQLVQTSDILDVTDRLNTLMAIQTARTLSEERTAIGRDSGMSK